METFITHNLFSLVLTALFSLICYLFNGVIKRIDTLENNERNSPINKIDASIAEIKTDIKWIKSKLFEDKPVK